MHGPFREVFKARLDKDPGQTDLVDGKFACGRGFETRYF